MALVELHEKQEGLEQKLAAAEVSVDSSQAETKLVGERMEQEKERLAVVKNVDGILDKVDDPNELRKQLEPHIGAMKDQSQTAKESSNHHPKHLQNVVKSEAFQAQNPHHLITHKVVDVAATTMVLQHAQEQQKHLEHNHKSVHDNEKVKSAIHFAKTVGSSFSGFIQNVDKEDLASAASTLLQLSGVVVSALPFGAPLGNALKLFGDAVKGASYNKAAASVLTRRVGEFLKVISDVILDISDAFEGKSEEIIKPTLDAVKASQDFIVVFCSKGFLKAMMSSSKDQKKLIELDHGLQECTKNLGLLIGSKTLNLAKAADEKLDALTKMMEQLQNAIPAGSNDPAQIDPQVLADIANKAGCACADEIKHEMEGVGVKLEKIQECIDALGDKLTKMESRLEETFEKVSEVKDSLDRQSESLSMMHAAQTKDNEKILRKLEALCNAKGAPTDAPIVWSSPEQVLILADPARDFLSKKPSFDKEHILLNSDGFGKNANTLDGIEGEAGGDGRHGEHGTNGAGGANRLGEDGGNGADGDHGDNGKPGKPGSNAHSSCTVFIAYNGTVKGKREYMMKFALDHFGQRSFTVDPENAHISPRILIQLHGGNGGRGGRGGNGGNGGNGDSSCCF